MTMGRPRKYFMTDEIIAQLADHTILLHEIAKQSGIPRKTLTKWSVKLGVARQINWTMEDEEYLREHIGKKTIAQLAKKLHRSEDAIKEKCRCMDLSRTPRCDGYTLKSVAMGLACSKWTVMAWIEQGWLKSVRRGPDALAWNISESALRKFLREHPEEIRWKYMSPWSRLWIRDLLPKNKRGETS